MVVVGFCLIIIVFNVRLGISLVVVIAEDDEFDTDELDSFLFNICVEGLTVATM